MSLVAQHRSWAFLAVEAAAINAAFIMHFNCWLRSLQAG